MKQILINENPIGEILLKSVPNSILFSNWGDDRYHNMNNVIFEITYYGDLYPQGIYLYFIKSHDIG